ncbi:MAG TPA: hypothetical protein VGE76_16155 [Opitutaceae bacterium]
MSAPALHARRHLSNTSFGRVGDESATERVMAGVEKLQRRMVDALRVASGGGRG